MSQEDDLNTTEGTDYRPAVQVEAQAEPTHRSDGSVPVKMGNGKTIFVPMQIMWRKSAADFFGRGDLDSWAESVLSETDLAAWDEWIDTDPINGELLDFIEALGKETGLAAGGNRASRRFSRRTRTN